MSDKKPIKKPNGKATVSAPTTTVGKAKKATASGSGGTYATPDPPQVKGKGKGSTASTAAPPQPPPQSQQPQQRQKQLVTAKEIAQFDKPIVEEGNLQLHRQETKAATGMLLRGASFMETPKEEGRKKKTKHKAARTATAAEDDEGDDETSSLSTSVVSMDISDIRQVNSSLTSATNSPPGICREPTMIKNDKRRLVGSPLPGKLYTFVLDLDETIVYARDGPLYARAHLKELLLVMNKVGEVIVWTAGDRDYAKAVLRQINIGDVIQHLVYRHKTWFDENDYTKDLRKLGRNMDYLLIIENTPDCLRLNPKNGIIVNDYEGGGEKDCTLKNLIRLVNELNESQMPVPTFLAQSQLLKTQSLPVGPENEEEVEMYCVGSRRLRLPNQKKGGDETSSKTESTVAAENVTKRKAGAGSDAKVVKRNRDKAPTAQEKAAAAAPSRLTAPTASSAAKAKGTATPAAVTSGKGASKPLVRSSKRTRETD